MVALTVQVQTENPAASYEFINSLTSVRSLSELLLDYPGMDDTHRTRFLSIIREETGRLLQLLGQLTPEPDIAGRV